MRKVSRRGILAGLTAMGATPAAAITTGGSEGLSNLPKPKFLKGQIMPVARLYTQRASYGGALGYCEPSVVYEYEIYDGSKFVPLNSLAGQEVVKELS